MKHFSDISGRMPVLKSMLLFILLANVFAPRLLSACDSTLLELLTGSNAQETFSEKFLVISSKMQVTATLSQAFNHAAAEKMHHEVMDSWLYVASQITSNPPGSATADPGFHATVVNISRELGLIRQQLSRRELDHVHDQLEICVSRISLLAAMISGHQPMKDFLGFELLTLERRPQRQSFASSQAEIVATEFVKVLDGLNLPDTGAVAEKVTSLKHLFEKFRSSVSNDRSTFSRSSMATYLEIYNEFSALKKLLLAENYFVRQP